MVELASTDFKITEREISNAGVETLMTYYDDSASAILKLLERRRFLAYFYLGDHELKQISADIAVKYKVDLGTDYFPATFLKEFIEFYNTPESGISPRFLIRSINHEGRIIENTWKVRYLSDVDYKLGILLNSLRERIDGNNFVSLLSNLTATNYKEDIMLLAGLFASGKFIQFYREYIYKFVEQETSGTYDFDPLTGLVTNRRTGKQYRFSELRNSRKGITDDETYRYKLYYNIPEKYALFCVFCEYVSRGYNPYYNNPKNAGGFTITSFWDFTPIRPRPNETKVRPDEPLVTEEDNFPPFITDPTFRMYLRNIMTEYMTQTKEIDNPRFSYKNIWEGAIFKNDKGYEVPLPIYYCIPLDEHGSNYLSNPLKDEQIYKDITDAIEKIKKTQKEIMQELVNATKNITELKSCVNSNTSIVTAFVTEGASFDTVQTTTCSFEENVKTEADASPTLKASGDITVDGEKMNFKSEFEFDGVSGGDAISKGALYGIIAGGAVLIIFIAIALVFYVRSRNKKILSELRQSLVQDTDKTVEKK